MKIDDAFPSNYIKAADLGESQPIVVISTVKVEPVGKSKEMKPVIYFEGKQKGLILNKTNAKTIAAVVGSNDTDDWLGCRIRLYATEVEFQGETVDAIRVKAPSQAKPKPKAKPLPALAVDPELDDEIGSDEEVPF